MAKSIEELLDELLDTDGFSKKGRIERERVKQQIIDRYTAATAVVKFLERDIKMGGHISSDLLQALEAYRKAGGQDR